MIRFVGNHPNGLPQKRSQTLKACEQCRKRKKRCTHNESSERELQLPQASSIASSSTPASTQHHGSEPEHRVSSLPSSAALVRSDPVLVSRTEDLNNDNESDDGSGDRFIGELNPESIFFAATSPENTASPGDENVGIWVSRKVLEGFRNRTTTNSAVQSINQDPLVANVFRPYVQRQCQQLLPPHPSYTMLYLIYVKEIHPVFPVIDLAVLDASVSGSSCNVLLIKQAICVAASASPRAEKYLQLPTQNGECTLTEPGKFATQLATAIRTSIDMGFVRDHVVILQTLTLLALFLQFSHQSDLSAELSARAISYSQTLGLHLEVPDTRRNHVYLTRLFCCVWAVDKLNAAFQGRPTIMHEQDFGRDFGKAVANQDSCFRLTLNVIHLLDGVIAYYRPRAPDPTMAGRSIAPFEDLIRDSDAVRVSSSLLATIELLYHAVALLSCRSKTSGHAGSALEMRETISATSIVTIIGTEFNDKISHLPLAPYALSLSLRVFYRELRFNSRSPFTRNRARKQLLNACKLLRNSFAHNFPSVVKVAELAEQTIREMEKVYSSLRQRLSTSRSNSEPVEQNDQSGYAGDTLPQFSDNTQSATEPSMIQFDPSPFEGLPDLDVFELFDSNFHLDAIDAVLVDNMAVPFPIDFSDAGNIPFVG